MQRDLGANLRAHRKTLDLSQEELAEHIGMHRTRYGAIERGEKNLTLLAVERLADALGVGALDLLQPPDGPRS